MDSYEKHKIPLLFAILTECARCPRPHLASQPERVFNCGSPAIKRMCGWTLLTITPGRTYHASGDGATCSDKTRSQIAASQVYISSGGTA